MIFIWFCFLFYLLNFVWFFMFIVETIVCIIWFLVLLVFYFCELWCCLCTWCYDCIVYENLSWWWVVVWFELFFVLFCCFDLLLFVLSDVVFIVTVFVGLFWFGNWLLCFVGSLVVFWFRFVDLSRICVLIYFVFLLIWCLFICFKFVF